MYLSRISLSPHVDVQQVAHQVCRDAYREHQFLWRMFEEDPKADRDFLFRRDSQSKHPRFYLLSQRPPLHTDGLWQTESKAFEPKIQAGQKLAFSLRANAVVTRRNEEGRHVRHDVVMDRKHRMGYKDKALSDRPPLAELVQEAGLEWLQNRAERHGFQVQTDTVRAEGYLQHRAFKRGGRKPIRYSTLDFAGQLTVADAELFRQALLHGIGPAKAFGCGLLLVRRV